MTDVIVQGGAQGTQAKYRSFDGGAYEALVHALAPYDEKTGAALVIDTIHHEVHEGEMFHSEHNVASLANGNNCDFLLAVGAKEVHATWEAFAGGQVTVYLYEAPTIAAQGDGTALPIYNMKRAATNQPLAVATHTPTVSATGSTALVNGRILPGGSSPQTRVGGGIRSGSEWILQPGTKYLLRVTNTSGTSIAVNVTLEWYEE